MDEVEGEADDTDVAGSEDYQQIAQSNPHQILSRVDRHFPYDHHPQQVQQRSSSSSSPSSSSYYSPNDGHVQKAQSRAFEEFEDTAAWSQSGRRRGQGRYLRYGSPSNERVVVKVVPALGFSLDDPNERRAFFQAVSNGLLGDNSVAIMDANAIQQQQNIIQSQQSRHSLNPQQLANFNFFPIKSNAGLGSKPILSQRGGPIEPPSPNRFRPLGGNFYYNNQHLNSLRFNSARDELIHQQPNFEEAYDVESKPSIFKGSSSYTVPLSSVGRLETDSNSVSGYDNLFALFGNRRINVRT